jgi:hypothetical protein
VAGTPLAALDGLDEGDVLDEDVGDPDAFGVVEWLGDLVGDGDRDGVSDFVGRLAVVAPPPPTVPSDRRV